MNIVIVHPQILKLEPITYAVFVDRSGEYITEWLTTNKCDLVFLFFTEKQDINEEDYIASDNITSFIAYGLEGIFRKNRIIDYIVSKYIDESNKIFDESKCLIRECIEDAEADMAKR